MWESTAETNQTPTWPTIDLCHVIPPSKLLRKESRLYSLNPDNCIQKGNRIDSDQKDW